MNPVRGWRADLFITRDTFNQPMVEIFLNQ